MQVKYATTSGLKILSKEEKRVKALITMFKANNIPLQFSTIFLTDRDHLQDMRNEYLFIILVAAAKNAVTRCWLLPAPPTMSDCRDSVNESVTFSIRLKKNVFAKLWCEWVNFMKPLQPDFRDLSAVFYFLLRSTYDIVAFSPHVLFVCLFGAYLDVLFLMYYVLYSTITSDSKMYFRLRQMAVIHKQLM